jgi:signal transduction histidine kinase
VIDPRPAQRPPWVDLAAGVALPPEPQVRRRRVIVQVICAAVVVIVGVGIAGVIAARRLAGAEAVNDAAATADLLAESVVQPVLTDGVVTGDPAALATLNSAVRDHVLGGSIVRVKIWTPDGTIVYSDEPRLVGQQFDLGRDEQGVLTNPITRADISDLEEPENVYERGSGPLLEVYRPVWTPSGSPLLFETYLRYDEVLSRSSELWRGFAGVTLSSILLLVVLLLPILWRLLDRLRQGQHRREALLQQSVDASDDERRRIAGTLHDGVVQDLVATSYALAGAAERTRHHDPAAAGELDRASETVRSSVGGLRSLLVDLYPQSLTSAGLRAAVEDLAGPLRQRGISVTVDVPEPSTLADADDRLVYRVTRECLTNVLRHARASSVQIRLENDDSGVTLEIADDGVGFEPATLPAAIDAGHFGVRALTDTVRNARGTLRVSTAVGAGTRWQLRMDR